MIHHNYQSKIYLSFQKFLDTVDLKNFINYLEYKKLTHFSDYENLKNISARR